MLAGQIALMIAAAFTGAAFYIGFVEHPARAGLDDASQLAEWKPAYKRGFAMQAGLAVAGFLFGLLAWWQSGAWAWIAGALILLFNWPYTLAAMLRLNNRLMALELDQAGPESRLMIERWGRLHAARTALGALAALFFVWAGAA